MRNEKTFATAPAIVLLRQAITIDPGNYDASWRLAKFNYYLATHTDNNDERNRHFAMALRWVRLRSNYEKPDRHWLGANYGAATESTIAGLATVGDIRNEMETVLRLDEVSRWKRIYGARFSIS
jgi:hypothetical protein